MATAVTGGCACGAIRYECTGDPLFGGSCYCRDCQRSSGTSHSSGFFVPVDAVKIKGEARYHTVTAESGNQISRGFCPTCGSPVFTKLAAMPTALGIKLASLDDPNLIRPSLSIFTASAPAWATFIDGPKFPKMRP